MVWIAPVNFIGKATQSFVGKKNRCCCRLFLYTSVDVRHDGCCISHRVDVGSYLLQGRNTRSVCAFGGVCQVLYGVRVRVKED